MAPPPIDYEAEEGLQGSLSNCRVCLHHHPYLPIWADWLHGLLQGRQSRCLQASPYLYGRGRGEAVQVLQPRDPQGFVRLAYLCSCGIEVEV